VKVPLLLVFHGHGEHPPHIETLTGFDELANIHNFIVVYPQGVDNSWNDGRGATAAQQLHVNDVAFVQVLVRHLEANYNIDPKRVYATGFSNGGMLTERLACQLANLVAAVAPVAGPIAQPIIRHCHSSRPISVFEVQGTSDPEVLYGGGKVQSSVGGPVSSEHATINVWAARDGCRKRPYLAILPDAPSDGTGVVELRYAHCSGGTAIDAVSIIHGTHMWPSSTASRDSASPRDLGVDFDLSASVWAFLSQFHL